MVYINVKGTAAELDKTKLLLARTIKTFEVKLDNMTTSFEGQLKKLTIVVNSNKKRLDAMPPPPPPSGTSCLVRRWITVHQIPFLTCPRFLSRTVCMCYVVPHSLRAIHDYTTQRMYANGHIMH